MDIILHSDNIKYNQKDLLEFIVSNNSKVSTIQYFYDDTVTIIYKQFCYRFEYTLHNLNFITIPYDKPEKLKRIL
jgi:hypothetical protein